MTKILRTPKQQQKEARDIAIYKEFNSLMENEQNSKVAVATFIAKKHSVALSTVWLAIKRVEAKQQSSTGRE